MPSETSNYFPVCKQENVLKPIKELYIDCKWGSARMNIRLWYKMKRVNEMIPINLNDKMMSRNDVEELQQK